MDGPVIKATLQAGLLSALSNIISQAMTAYSSNGPYTFNARELLQFVGFSMLSCPPNFVWQAWLESTYPGTTEKQAGSKREGEDSGKLHGHQTTKQRPASAPTRLDVKNTAIKFALDQTLGAAVNTVLFLAGMAMLRGQSLESIRSDVMQGFWPLMLAGQKLWPLVSIISFTLIPFEHRMLFGGLVGLGWGVYLSLVAGGSQDT